MKKANDLDPFKPYYPPNVKYKTSAEIISEARSIISRDTQNSNMSTLSGGSGVPRTLGTQRPFTPREKQRTLFGKVGRSSRPPSAVNLKYLQSQTNDYIKTNAFAKKGQLSPVKSSEEFGHNGQKILDDIDERSELPSLRRRKETLRKTKSLHYEALDNDDGRHGLGAKLILPSLNGLAKPLHQRRGIGNQHSTLLQSLSEEREEANHSNDRFSPITVPKSYEFTFQNESEDDSERFNVRSTVDVFNKRRLFSDFKSKSEESAVDEGFVHSEKLHISIKGLPQKSYDYLNLSSIGENVSNENKTSPSSYESNKNKSIKSEAFYDILENLSNKDSKYFSEEDVTEMLLMLYNTVEKETPWANINSDEKVLILSILYKYIESSNERLLMSMARIILALRVTGSNLSGVCKLIFKIARNDKNDHLFLNDNLLELFIVGLGRAEPLHDAECLVYGYGALKFLGMNPTLLERLRPLGVLPLMTLHLKMFNEARSENSHAVGEQGCHGLYQLTGALRNMAGGDAMWNSALLADRYSNISTPNNSLLDFVAEGTLTEICRTLSLFVDDLDVEINVSRTLSVLSADYECCINLCEQKNILPHIIKLLQTYTEKTPLVVRLNYILGNMVACNNEIRTKLYEEPGSMSVLLKILNTYLKQSWSNSKIDSAENIIIGSDLDGSSGSDEDVMVKTIRVIANICMNPSVGKGIVDNGDTGRDTLSWILRCLRQNSPLECTELTVSSLATLNNISYYHAGEQMASVSTTFGDFEIQFCEVLCRLLSQDTTPCLTEALRVLGNMTRSKLTRDYIVDTGTVMDIVKHSKSDDPETSLAAAGVLVNVAADESARKGWLNTNGVNEAINALQNSMDNHHWQLALLLCQVLWNACPLSNMETTTLVPLLLDGLDEQVVFGDMEAVETSFIDIYSTEDKPAPARDSYLSVRIAWEEFATVALNLLDKVDPVLDIECDDEDIQDSLITALSLNGSSLIPM